MSLSLPGFFWLLPLLLLLVFWTWRQYARVKPQARGPSRLLLPLLRSASWVLLVSLLLAPHLDLQREREDPATLAVLIDDSASMPFLDARQQHRAWLADLADALAPAKLRLFAFGDSIQEINDGQLDSLTYLRGQTNLDQAIGQLRRELRSEVLRGILLVSDGNVSAGRWPLEQVREMEPRLWTAGSGRLQPPPDLLLRDLRGNRLARLGVREPVRAEIEARGLAGRAARAELRIDGKLLDSKDFVLPEEGRSSEVELEWLPESQGDRSVELSLQLLDSEGPEEASLLNNRRMLQTKVRESGHRLQVLSSSPGPSLAWLRQALSSREELEWTPLRPDELAEGAPEKDPDLLLLVDWPRSSDRLSEALRSLLRRVPLLAVDLGAMDWKQLPLMPLRGEGAPGKDEGPCLPSLPHPVLGEESSLAELQAVWREMPPLAPARSRQEAAAGASVLLSREEQPVLALNGSSPRRAALAVAGPWRWQIGSQLSLGENERASSLARNLVRWLIAASDQGPLQVRPLKDVVSAGEALRFEAYLREEDGRPRDGARLSLALSDSSGTQREAVMEARGEGRYTLNLGGLPAGALQWQVLAEEGDRPVLADSGSVRVDNFNAEYLTGRRDSATLQALARAGEGRAFDLDSEEDLRALRSGEGFDSLDRSPRKTPLSAGWDLHREWWILLIAIGLLCLEWLLRKLNGQL